MNVADRIEILQRVVDARGDKHTDFLVDVTAARIMYGAGHPRKIRRQINEAVKAGLLLSMRKVGHRNTLFYRTTPVGEASVRMFNLKPRFTDFAKFEFLQELHSLFPQSPILNAICDDYADK